MIVEELTAGVRRHYENGYNNITDFIDAHDDTLPPEVLEETRTLTHAAGLPFHEKPYNGEETDPYVYDGRMSIEDYELMHRMITQERSETLSEQFSILIDSRSRFETGRYLATHARHSGAASRSHEKCRHYRRTFSSTALQTPSKAHLTCRFPLSKTAAWTN